MNMINTILAGTKPGMCEGGVVVGTAILDFRKPHVIVDTAAQG